MPPDSARDVLILPFSFTLLGVIFFFTGLRASMAGGKGWARWVGFVFIGWALWSGLSRLWDMYNPNEGFIYRSTLQGRDKEFAAHFIAPAMPLIALAGIFINHKLRLRSQVVEDA
jgi:hypothetical protein